MTTPACPSYAGYRFPAEIISHAVWLYFRFPLSLRMVDELLAARGIIVSYETVRQWALKFGQVFARHCQFVGLRSQWRVIGTACPWLCRSGDAGDLGPNPEGLGAVGPILGGRHLVAAEVEEAVNPVVGGEEALGMAG